MATTTPLEGVKTVAVNFLVVFKAVVIIVHPPAAPVETDVIAPSLTVFEP